MAINPLHDQERHSFQVVAGHFYSQPKLLKTCLRPVLILFQNHVIANQLKRQNDELIKLREILDAKNVSELKLQVNKCSHLLNCA